MICPLTNLAICFELLSINQKEGTEATVFVGSVPFLFYIVIYSGRICTLRSSTFSLP